MSVASLLCSGRLGVGRVSRLLRGRSLEGSTSDVSSRLRKWYKKHREGPEGKRDDGNKDGKRDHDDLEEHEKGIVHTERLSVP